MEEKQDRNVQLTSEQEGLLQDLEDKIKERRKEKGKLPKLILAAAIVLIIGALIATCFRKPASQPTIQPVETGQSEEEEQPTLAPDKPVMEVHFIDVGQGDCILITGSGQNLLIDCGEMSQANKVIGYLEKQGVKKIDHLIATHPHSDHMGAMSQIIDRFKIGRITIPHIDESDIPTTLYFDKFLDSVEKKNLTLTEAKPGKKLKACGGEIEFIAPVSRQYKNTNNYSIGIVLRFGENSFIFTGDAETAAEQEMLASGRVPDVDVYKAAHHGSDTSTSDEFLAAISPEIVVISVGADNSYGHPCESTLKKLKKYTKNIYRTDKSGTVIISSDGEELVVRTERRSR